MSYEIERMRDELTELQERLEDYDGMMEAMRADHEDMILEAEALDKRLSEHESQEE
jgi:hypothetical protein